MSVRSLATRYTDVPLSGSFQPNTAQLYMWKEEVKVQSRHMLSKNSTYVSLDFGPPGDFSRPIRHHSFSLWLPSFLIDAVSLR